MRKRLLVPKYIALWICGQIHVHRELRSERPCKNTIRNLRMLNGYVLAIGSYLGLPNSLRNIVGCLLGRCVSSKKFSRCGQSIRTFRVSSYSTTVAYAPNWISTHMNRACCHASLLICQHTHAKYDHGPEAYPTSHSLLFHHPAGHCWLPVRQASLRYLWCWRDE